MLQYEGGVNQTFGAPMEGVVTWFELRGEIPLYPPPRVREYGPISDDIERPVDEYFSDSIKGVACAIEYCDSHGWMSLRTIRCLSIDPHHPASLRAYCSVRRREVTFRVDRIISIIDLRSGTVLPSDEHVALFAPYLPADYMGPHLHALIDVQNATRDGVFALLHVAMRDGFLGDGARSVIFSYVQAEAEEAGCVLPPDELIALWLDNLAPNLDCVIPAVKRLFNDRDKVSRLLPWMVQLARSEPDLAGLEGLLRDLIAEVRRYFRPPPHDHTGDLRAS